MSGATTPGRAAYEAWNGGAENAKHSAVVWKNYGADFHDRWEAAAQAGADASAIGGILTAVKASSGDLITIAFNRPLSARTAHDIAERWKAYAPDVTLVLVDDVAAIKTSAAAGEPDVDR